MTTNHGHFTLYTPELPDDHPFKGHNSILYLKNAADLDWYKLAHRPPTGTTWVMVRGGRVCSHSTDPSTLWPIDSDLIETDQHVVMGYTYANGIFQAP